MTIWALKCAKRLRDAGDVLRRDALARRAIEIVTEYVAGASGSYKESMVLAGRLKAISQAAKFDGYWSEKVNDGFHREMLELERLAKAKVAAAGLHPKSESAA